MNESESKKAIKWYYRPVMVIVAILVLGPLALPIVWMSPALKRWHKAALSVVTLVLTLWLIKATIDIYRSVSNQMRDMQALF